MSRRTQHKEGDGEALNPLLEETAAGTERRHLTENCLKFSASMSD
jgi:hypothetical protein